MAAASGYLLNPEWKKENKHIFSIFTVGIHIISPFFSLSLENIIKELHILLFFSWKSQFSFIILFFFFFFCTLLFLPIMQNILNPCFLSFQKLISLWKYLSRTPIFHHYYFHVDTCNLQRLCYWKSEWKQNTDQIFFDAVCNLWLLLQSA